MLVEKENRVGGFKLGDAVLIKSTGQVGTIVAIESGTYKVRIAQGTVQESASNLERREVLLG